LSAGIAAFIHSADGSPIADKNLQNVGVSRMLIFGCAAVSIHPTTCCIASEHKNGLRETAYIKKKTQIASN
jgi:hypothetical protein